MPYFENSTLLNLSDGCFEYGTFELNKKNASKNITENYELSYLKQKMNKPQLSYKSGEEWDVNNIDEKRNFGTLVHKTLSKLESKNNLDSVLTLMNEKGEITAALKIEINYYVTDLFTDPHFDNYFNLENEVLNERAIINQKGQKLIPDKIILAENETIVIDFKTGQETESHQKQLNSYIKLLRDMDYKNVKG